MPDVIIPDPPQGPISTELRVGRRQTTQYIKDNPFNAVLTRSGSVPDGAGGRRRIDPTPLPGQVVRIIQSDESEAVERMTVDGRNVRPTLNMMCEWDADVAVGDRLVWRDIRLEVVYVTDLGYEKMAELAAY